MITLDLRQEAVTIAELLKLASDDPVRIVNRDGQEFVVEAADAFDREVAELGKSERFQAFLAERSKESGSVALEDVERRLGR